MQILVFTALLAFYATNQKRLGNLEQCLGKELIVKVTDAVF